MGDFIDGGTGGGFRSHQEPSSNPEGSVEYWRELDDKAYLAWQAATSKDAELPTEVNDQTLIQLMPTINLTPDSMSKVKPYLDAERNRRFKRP